MGLTPVVHCQTSCLQDWACGTVCFVRWCQMGWPPEVVRAVRIVEGQCSEVARWFAGFGFDLGWIFWTLHRRLWSHKINLQCKWL